MLRPAVLLSLTLAACGDPPVAPAPPVPDQDRRPAPLSLQHDFGIIPHGEQRSHEFELDLAAIGEPLVPLRVHLECSCGRADVRLRDAADNDRFIDGSGYARNLPGVGERALLHVEIDTRKREPVDLPPTDSHGYILLQPLDDDTGLARVRWPFVLHFGVDSPVELKPFASLDFGRVHESAEGELLVSIRGDEQHRAARFTAASSSDPALTVALEPGEDHVVLRARCRSGALGNHRALVTIDSDIEDYLFAIEAVWKVVPDLEVLPIAKVSVTARLDVAQDAEAETRQFVLVTDHDTARSPEFLVERIVWTDGRDASSHFAVTFTPLPGRERQQRMTVRYLGGLTEAFRGRIVLTKPGGGPQLPIELVLFPQRPQ